MPRRQVKRGGRKFQPEKPLIYVFCEGESEQAYAKFLKEHFADADHFPGSLRISEPQNVHRRYHRRAFEDL